MRERLHVGCVDGHHWVELKGEINAFGLDGELERFTISVERPGTLDCGNRDGGFIHTVEQTFLEAAIVRPVKYLHRTVGNRYHSNDSPDPRGIKASGRSEKRSSGGAEQFAKLIADFGLVAGIYNHDH